MLITLNLCSIELAIRGDFQEIRAVDQHLEEAVELLLCELTAAPDMSEAQEDLLSCGRVHGIGPNVMKRAAAKIGIMFEKQVRPDIRASRIYWRLPGNAA